MDAPSSPLENESGLWGHARRHELFYVVVFKKGQTYITFDSDIENIIIVPRQHVGTIHHEIDGNVRSTQSSLAQFVRNIGDP